VVPTHVVLERLGATGSGRPAPSTAGIASPARVDEAARVRFDAPRMRIALELGRLAPAILAALVLCVSLASASHAHGAAIGHGPQLAAQAPRAESAGAADLDCALCAATARLSHGAASPPVPIADGALQRFSGLAHRESVPRCAPLSLTESRAPPRLG